MPRLFHGHYKVPDGIKVIARKAFSKCKGLTKVDLPDSVLEIETFAFEGCDNLQDITFSKKLINVSKGAFRGCNSLRQIALPDGVKSIQSDAFSDCKKLKKVLLSESVDVSGLAFKNCDSLTNSIIVQNVLVKVPHSLSGKYVVDERIEVISDGAFQGCKRITEIILPINIKEIGNRCFEDCEVLEYMKENNPKDLLSTLNTFPVSLPRSIRVIGEYAFSGCKKISSVSIGDGIRKIPEGLFCGCEKITDVELPSSIEIIGASSFRECINLRKVSFIGINLVEIGEHAFEGCKSISNFLFLNGSWIWKISKAVFKGCHSLTSISVPCGVTAIENEAFSGCSSLKSVYIPSSVEYIKTDAFKGCNSLEKFISEKVWKNPIEKLGLPATTLIIIPSNRKTFDIGDTDDGPMIHTHGRLRPCPYCDSDDITTYIDGTAYCNQCGKWYRYA